MFSLSTARRPNTTGAIYLASRQLLYAYYLSNWVKAMGPRQIHLNTKNMYWYAEYFFNLVH